MPPAIVAIVRTRPETVTDDYARLLNIAGFAEVAGGTGRAIVVPELAWHQFHPAVNATPWQLDAVLSALDASTTGRDISVRYAAAHGLRTRFAAILNRHRAVLDRYGIDYDDAHTIETEYHRPGSPDGVLARAFPNGVRVPVPADGFHVLLPTLKTNAATVVSGAVTTLFRYLVRDHARIARRDLPAALTEALGIARARKTRLFAVMDGTFAGTGPGPRRITPHEENVLLASSDPVALDAIAARLMGTAPLTVPYIRLAHEAMLGTGDLVDIECVGDDLDGLGYACSHTTPVHDGLARWIEDLLPARASHRFALTYDDFLWYKRHAEKEWGHFEKSDWGKVFGEYRK